MLIKRLSCSGFLKKIPNRRRWPLGGANIGNLFPLPDGLSFCQIATQVYLHTMKSFVPFLLITLLLASCNQRKTTEVSTDSEQITTNDSSAVVPQPDSIDSVSLDPKINETALQQDPPAAVSNKPKVCNPNFTLISSPKKNHNIYYVTGFNAGEFKCWVDIEKHGEKLCGGNPCVITYVDKADVTITKTPPFYLDAKTLQTAGIGWYEYNGKYWELNGAKKWKRTDKGYGYYNTDNQLGG